MERRCFDQLIEFFDAAGVAVGYKNTSRIHIFLTVALYEPITIVGIWEHTDIDEGTIYSNLTALGEGASKGKPGVGLITRIPAQRQKAALYILTPKGKATVLDITKAYRSDAS